MKMREGRARGYNGQGSISSSESALKLMYGNVGGKKMFSPAAGFRPSFNLDPHNVGDGLTPLSNYIAMSHSIV